MKSILRTLCAIGMFLGAGWSFAQTANTNLRVDVPFAFHVDRALLPAGHYSIRSFGAADGKTLLIQSSDNQWVATVRTHGVQASTAPQLCKLRFLNFGDQNFLWEIWVPGRASGYQLEKGSQVIELESANRAKALDLIARGQR